LDEENGDRIAFALVHQRDQREEVVGYVLAAVDTPSFHTQCEGAEGSGAWWPTLRARYGRGGEVYAGLGENEKQLVQAEIFREHRLPPSPPSGSSGNGTGSKDGEGSNEGAAALSYSATLSLYPSHLHIDITAPYQGRSYGTVMMRKILRRLQQQGSTGVHLGMHESNERAYAFYTKMGFRRLGTVGGEWILGLAF
jgi:GNAT superfamily N-acetyltransferase